MTFSIESRVPFLTPRIAQFVLSLPESYIVAPDGTTKAVFRKAMEGIVPQPVLARRDKIGFATPERPWLSSLEGWVDGVLASEAAHTIPALDPAAVRRERGRTRHRVDPPTWRWINCVRWAELLDVEFA
jgi:asparagine synthase (glutamine-hydrolysing)